MHLELLPPAQDELGQRTLAAADIGGHVRPRRLRHRAPRGLDGRPRRAHVVDELRGGAMRARLDRGLPPLVAAGVLVDHLVAARRLGAARMAVGIAGHMGEDVADRPARQPTRLAGVGVGKAGDGRVEATLRVDDPPDLAVWHHAAEATTAGWTNPGRSPAGTGGSGGGPK